MSFTGYRLRVIDGEFTGLWLSRIDVSKPGTVFAGDPDWYEVARHPESYQINPKFGDETSTWRGIDEQAAKLYQTIVSSAGIQTEIVAP